MRLRSIVLPAVAVAGLLWWVVVIGIVTLIPVILDNGRTAPRRSRAAQAAHAVREAITAAD